MRIPDRPSNVIPFAARRPRPALEREARARRHAEERSGGVVLIDDPRATYDEGEPVADGPVTNDTEDPEAPR